MQWTEMLRDCYNVGNGEAWQRTEMHGAGELKTPRPKLACSVKEEREGEECAMKGTLITHFAPISRYYPLSALLSSSAPYSRIPSVYAGKQKQLR
jgi:hypothetical protein